MSAVRMDGKGLSAKIRGQLKERVAAFKAEYGYVPGLTVILVGEDPASQIYVRNKERGCNEAGMASDVIRMPAQTTQEELLALIEKLNRDDKVHGILVQLPLPKGIDELSVLRTIDPAKDVDGFHVVNAGKLFIGEKALVACTPKGIMRLLEEYDIDLEGKNAVVVGRSNIVGKPISMLLLQRNATVTICHSRTKNLKDICRGADVLVAAVGKANLITGDMVKPGAVVIDVGMNRLPESKKVVGDVDFESVEPVAGYITPVPGGVGPMTIAMLLENTLEAFKANA
ncbi:MULTISPECIES: bifunctional methylenetetrahydrofolate dehydrogenase/methenyltetrahydrofolate cyclohydrolase FolD [unclassified Clostridium]|uniref:bifunctional methylenetetrahydrofolate dehydrogenase/methenyltetrahydrofolate cyclohydrolase FolD n=1 Tax=unclassified Clostridium TaxID=2614128 RepID=UPI001105BB28|nr:MULTISPECIES: bifunctional methylenetetrahydrofolate dehydrogenase/methenyltetrahydrofolate cyclohydrolase FolD [unclassified Clostridium]